METLNHYNKYEENIFYKFLKLAKCHYVVVNGGSYWPLKNKQKTNTPNL